MVVVARGGWLWAFAWIGVVLVLCLAGMASASERRDGVLPVPAGLRPQVDFWKKVFAEFSEWDVVIHDREDLSRIYKVAAFGWLRDTIADEAAAVTRRREIVREEIEAIRGTLLRLHTYRDEPERWNAHERKVAAMFATDTDPHRFLLAAGENRIRAQTGLRERFAIAVRTAQRYLPYMERIFREEGLPLELTRLPFVESSFDVMAYSKVGAAGLWQFMPATARQYNMRVDDVVDERRDPFTSTVAAARFLKGNFAALGSWPVAITAYNHGRGGMMRAVKQLGTTDIMEIIRRYDGRTFGFASKNFYASFIAAIEVERDAARYFGPIPHEPPLVPDRFRLPHFVDFRELARLARIHEESLAELNIALSRQVRRGEVRVPRGYELRLPAGMGEAFRTRYAALSQSAKHDGQRSSHATHQVRRGETLSSIAARHGTSVGRLMADNGIRNPNHVRVGQRLKVRAGGGGGVAAAPQRSVTARAQVHKVEPGQTLSTIAKRYGTSVADIRRLNGISNPNHVRAGDRLRIPSR